MLAELTPYAYEAGLTPSEIRRATFGELRAVVDAWVRRQVREQDRQAWAVAHLMLASGNLRRGTRLDDLIRELLGREVGVIPGDTPATSAPERADPRELSPEASVAYMKAWVQARTSRTG